MTVRRLQTGTGGPSVNSVLGRLRGTRTGRGLIGSPVDTSTEAKASVTTSLSGANNDLTFTAAQAGTDGNSIRIRYVNPGANDAALAVTRSGQDITVSLATGVAGAITSIASEVSDLVNTTQSGIVVASNAAANTGVGVVTAMAYQTLSGGLAPS